MNRGWAGELGEELEISFSKLQLDSLATLIWRGRWLASDCTVPRNGVITAISKRSKDYSDLEAKLTGRMIESSRPVQALKASKTSRS